MEELRNGKILIVHQGAVGDLILALPAIKALRHVLQPARMEMMGHPWTLALVSGHPYAEAIMDINRAEMVPLFQDNAPLPATLKGYLDHFDAAFCFSRSETLASNLRRGGIRQVFTLPSFPDTRMHVIDHHLLSLKTLGISSTSTSPMVFVRDEERQGAERFLLQKGWDYQKIAAIHPGAGSRKKAWPATRFAALARLLASAGHKILILEGPADKAAAAEVRAGLKGIPYLLIRDLPLTRLAALLSFASLFIGNDSGISHLAAALKIPTIAIFGPTDPYVWAPRSDWAFWLQGQAGCAPCTRDEQRLCERQQCLDAIQVEQVMALIAEKGMIGGGLTKGSPSALAISNKAALHDRRAIPIEKSDRQYGETGISVPSP
jgi:ADP-heptose:LPS heptosyltransferase